MMLLIVIDGDYYKDSQWIKIKIMSDYEVPNLIALNANPTPKAPGNQRRGGR